MAEVIQIKLTEEEFLKGKISYPANYVIILMSERGELTTSSGISIGFNEDTTYGESDTSHIADVAAVHGTIVKQTDGLYFNRSDPERTMSWESDIDTEIGDVVWTHPLAAKNCQEILVGSDVYKVLRYEDLFVSKRGELVTPLNGHVVLEQVRKEKRSEFDVFDRGMDKTRGIVRWNGKNNKRYQNPNKSDIVGLEEGDLVVIDKQVNVYMLERNVWNSNFDGNNQYLCVQKSDIEFVL